MAERPSADGAVQFRLAVRLVTLDIEDLLDDVDRSGVTTRRGVRVLLQSQLSVLQQVDRDLATSSPTQRIRALSQSAVGVLPSLLNSVDRSNREMKLESIRKCRASVDALAKHLVR